MTLQEVVRIFLADDDEDDCLLFRDALERLQRKIELVISKDGVELMDTFEEKVPPPPDVLFLDLNMPRKSGFECLKEIKQNVMLKNIPVVILSTSGDDSNIQRTFQEGANFYARKPSSFDALVNLIEHVLGLNFEKENRDLSKFLIDVKSAKNEKTDEYTA